MKKVISFVILINLSVLFNCCNTTEPPPPPNGDKPTLELTLEDVSCIEAWLTLTTTNLELPATLKLKQINPAGDTISQILNLNTQDSLLYVDSLLPNQTYKFQSVIQSINQSEVKSNELNATTMDTTSHNFSFETFTFGGTAGSSTLYDCAIISSENIWCVGEIYVADTSQNGYTMYNAVHWDGSEWDLLRVPNYDYGGTLVYGALFTIIAFGENDVWFCSYSNLVHYDGINFLSRAQFMTSINFEGQVLKMWGTDGSNIYCVGRNGALYHYYGTGWTRIESGTNLNIGDIWGIPDGNRGYNKYLVTENALLTLHANNQLNNINVEPGMFLNSVWGITDKLIYTAGDGVVLYKNFNWEKIDRPDVNSIYVIKGQNYNDIYGISASYTILHFNGYNWANISSFPNDTYYSMNVLNNLAAIAGWQGDKAVIALIKRTQ
jgi:hypothetical protein